jgi:DNA mismatch endonuclease (patch repair protein)
MDTLNLAERSALMARVKGKHTKSELLVRRLVHGMGYRYRLHRRDLPGTPDLVFTGRHKVIFAIGCFRHRHTDCALARLPKSRSEFWLPKLTANAERDARNVRESERLGWGVLTIWECQLGDTAKLAEKVRGFLDAQR